MAGLFIETLRRYGREGKFVIHEFVVMPNHFHLLFTPSGVTLERAIQFIKGGFSYRAKKELGIGMEIWERGFVDRRIKDGDDYYRHAEYVRENPVRAGMVSSAEEYAYSSAWLVYQTDSTPQGLKPPVLRAPVRHD